METIEGPVAEADRTSELILWVGSATFPGREDHSLSISAREPDAFLGIHGPIAVLCVIIIG